jgi:hypothetical protein
VTNSAGAVRNLWDRPLDRAGRQAQRRYGYPNRTQGVRVPEEAVVTEVEGLFADVTPLYWGERSSSSAPHWK